MSTSKPKPPTKMDVVRHYLRDRRAKGIANALEKIGEPHRGAFIEVFTSEGENLDHSTDFGYSTYCHYLAREIRPLSFDDFVAIALDIRAAAHEFVAAGSPAVDAYKVTREG